MSRQRKKHPVSVILRKEYIAEREATFMVGPCHCKKRWRQMTKLNGCSSRTLYAYRFIAFVYFQYPGALNLAIKHLRGSKKEGSVLDEID